MEKMGCGDEDEKCLTLAMNLHCMLTAFHHTSVLSSKGASSFASSCLVSRPCPSTFNFLTILAKNTLDPQSNMISCQREKTYHRGINDGEGRIKEQYESDFTCVCSAHVHWQDDEHFPSRVGTLRSKTWKDRHRVPHNDGRSLRK